MRNDRAQGRGRPRAWGAVAVLLGTLLPGALLAAPAAAGSAPPVPQDPTALRTASHSPVLTVTIGGGRDGRDSSGARGAARGDGDDVVAEFSARTAGTAGWDLVEGRRVPVQDGVARLMLPSLPAGTVVEWTARSCRGRDCSERIEVATATVSPLLAAGSRPEATVLDYRLGEGLDGHVDIATGNLLVTARALAVPGPTGSVGLAYNSVAATLDASADGADAEHPVGAGWTQTAGTGVRAIEQPGGDVVVHDPTGRVGTFAARGSGRYTSPSGWTATLLRGPDDGWTLTDYASGVRHLFSAEGRLREVRDPDGGTLAIEYDDDGLPAAFTPSAGGVDTAPVRVVTEGGRVTRLVQEAPGLSRGVDYLYDAAGDLVGIADTLGRLTTLAYEGHRLVTVVAPGGIETHIAYDDEGRVASVRQVGDAGDTWTRLDLRSPTQVLVSYGAQEQEGSPVDGDRTAYTLTRDGTGRIAKVRDASGRTRAVLYVPTDDALLADLAPSAEPASIGLFTARGPGATGEPVAPEHRAGSVASQEWDAYGRLVTTTSALGVTTAYAYDAGDHLVQVTRTPGPEGGDATGDDATETEDVPPGAAPETETYSYDEAGRVTARVDSSGTTTYAYDRLWRLTDRTHSSDGVTVSYGYDASSRLSSVSDTRGTTGYAYDQSGELTDMTWAKDLPDEESKVAHTRFAVDDQGRRTDTWMLTNRNNTVWSAHSHTDYTDDGRVARVWADRSLPSVRVSDSARVVDLTYCYTEGAAAPRCSGTAGADQSLLRWVQDAVSGQLTTFAYDDARRLVRAETSPSTDGTIPRRVLDYAYDEDGDRVSATVTTDAGEDETTATQSFTVDELGRLTGEGYAYDAAGRLTSHPVAGSLGYDLSGQLTSVTNAEGSFAYSYAGGGEGELLSQALPGGKVDSFGYGRQDAAGLPIMERVRIDDRVFHLENDPDGLPVMLRTSAQTQALYVYDAVGSPVGLITDAGVVAFRYAFDPYGQASLTQSSGGLGVRQTPFLFGGNHLDRTTGWVRQGTRFYLPAEGRWAQPSTAQATTTQAGGAQTGGGIDATPGRSLSPYAYAASDPVNLVERTGRWTAPEPRDSGVLAGAVGLLEVPGLRSVICSTGVIPAEPFVLPGIVAGAEVQSRIGCDSFDVAAAAPWWRDVPGWAWAGTAAVLAAGAAAVLWRRRDRPDPAPASA